jgi:histidine triad (HIT) family protein
MNIFEKIIKKEIPSYTVFEDLQHIAILDINPINPGHVLVIPKKVVADILDMDTQSYAELFIFAQKVARVIKYKLKPVRVGYVVEGFGVPHVHIHLVPINHGNELNPLNAKSAEPKALQQMKDLLVR